MTSTERFLASGSIITCTLTVAGANDIAGLAPMLNDSPAFTIELVIADSTTTPSLRLIIGSSEREARAKAHLERRLERRRVTRQDLRDRGAEVRVRHLERQLGPLGRAHV